MRVQVLESDASNSKALYRRAQAYLASQEYVEAEQVIRVQGKSSTLLAARLSCSAAGHTRRFSLRHVMRQFLIE